jgi:hypothetical protein
VSNATCPRIFAQTSTDNNAVLYVAHATEVIAYVAIAQELPDFRTAVQQCLSQFIENRYCDRSLENQDLAMTMIFRFKIRMPALSLSVSPYMFSRATTRPVTKCDFTLSLQTASVMTCDPNTSTSKPRTCIHHTEYSPVHATGLEGRMSAVGRDGDTSIANEKMAHPKPHVPCIHYTNS